MSKVYGLHEIELQPGVRSEDFEKFVIEEVLPLRYFPGWEVRLLRGNRGERDGKYMIMFVIESVESRDRYFPVPDGQVSEEGQRFFDSHPEFGQMFEKWGKFATSLGEGTVTDYAMVSS